MQREISDLEQRLSRLKEAHGGSSSSSSGSSATSAPARRGPGRPAGSGRGPGRPAGSGRGPGRPAGSAKGRRGRPPASASTAAAGAGNEGPNQPAAGGAKRRGRKAGAGRKPSSLSGDQLASRQLQGRYLALVRQFPEARRAQYAKIAKERGREAAIRDMQESLKK
ncbi:MAG TPA: hypothetical protein VGF48_11900 [Thermoanaerobaculia bacterium]